MPRSIPNDSMDKNWTFSGKSLFLLDREDLINKSWLLKLESNHKDLSDQLTKSHSLLIKNWSSEGITEGLKLNNFSTVWENIWDKDFIYPTSYFYSYKHQEVKSPVEDSLLSKLSANPYFKSDSSIADLSNDWAEQYIKLIDPKELQQNIFEKRKHQSEDNLLSELVKLDLIRQCEELETKSLVEQIPETEIEEEESAATPQVTIEWKPFITTTQVSQSKLKFPLENSLPSMFLSYLKSKDFSKPMIEPLKDTPKWLKRLNSLTEKWSISRFIPEERTKVLFNSLDFESLTKQNVQWQDPQEKWFYLHLPLITLFFDKFREKYKKSLITTWEEPEYTFPLTAIGITDLLDPSKSKKSSIFSYEGIPSIRIGRDLELIQSVIDRYNIHYEQQAKKELAEEGFAPVELSKSLNSTELLDQLEKEDQEV